MVALRLATAARFLIVFLMLLAFFAADFLMGRACFSTCPRAFDDPIAVAASLRPCRTLDPATAAAPSTVPTASPTTSAALSILPGMDAKANVCKQHVNGQMAAERRQSFALRGATAVKVTRVALREFREKSRTQSVGRCSRNLDRASVARSAPDAMWGTIAPTVGCEPFGVSGSSWRAASDTKAAACWTACVAEALEPLTVSATGRRPPHEHG